MKKLLFILLLVALYAGWKVYKKTQPVCLSDYDIVWHETPWGQPFRTIEAVSSRCYEREELRQMVQEARLAKERAKAKAKAKAKKAPWRR